MEPPRWARRVSDRMDDADFLRSFHKWATIGWSTIGLGLSILWKNWLPWIVFMSLYANVAGEWSAWQSTRVEVNQIAQQADEVVSAWRDGARPKSRRSHA